MQDLPTVFVTEKGARRAKAGHPWVFESDIARLAGEPENGGLCTVLSPKERFLGTGFYNENSKIRVRLVSDNANDVCDTQFWRRRVRWALDYRKTVMGKDFPACRLIHGEADRFPGLTVDLFSDTLVVECLSLGTDRILDEILAALVEFLPDYGVRVGTVFERDEGELRIREGMEKRTGFRLSLAEHADGHTEIAENGIRYDVDFMNGQKTGFFLDQKYNRLAAAGIAKGRRVLDCFTHTGAFALNCLAGGAEHVTAVDISASAVEQARKNAALNGFPEGEGKGEISFCRADVFELLTDLVNDRSRREYDYIILDPPAFTKSSSTVKEAFRGYKDINYRAMRALPRGGYLASASCSHFMTRELFEKMLDEAAADAGVTLRQIESRAAAPDHPHLRTVPETDYLKFVLMQVV
ncbi:MAG: class I SAM-dependent rRNA methyltransferase [Clostridia bacterium]|nr:class I SAM-dependent rRNA methyltransferase [Clostridia bacterium]